MSLLLPFLLPVGLFLPGVFIARFLERRLWWASAFVVSLLVLFHSVFWLGVSGLSITLWSVLPCLLLAAAATARLTRRSKPLVQASGSWPSTTVDRILVMSTAIVGLTLLTRSAISPL